MPARELLIPPRRFRPEAGRFRWPARPILATCRTTDDLPLQQLRRELRSAGVGGARIAHNAFGPAALRVQRRAHEHGREAYRLRVAADGVTIWAQGDAGAYYALQTLRELVRVHGRSLPACRIDDWPDFPRRAVYHDCSRGKVPKIETLKALVERLAAWKINELQLYVEDVFRFRRHPKIGRGTSPFRADELLDLQAHCRRHHVRLVGSLASFGHMERIVSLPEYRHLGEGNSDPLFPHGATLCPIDPKSIRFMEELYEEFVPLFAPADFNMCCDETWELGKARSKAAVARRGAAAVYLDFVRKLCDLLRAHGKRPNAWADIVLNHPEIIPELPEDLVLLNWDYSARGANIPRTRELTGAGRAVMVCPATCSTGTHGSRLGTSMANIARFAAEGRRCGVEGLLNTDWGDDGHRCFLGVSLHGFAHGAAHSWNGRGADDTTFSARFCRHVFGDRRGRLARGLRALGRADEGDGGWVGLQRTLYYTLVEPTRCPPQPPVWPYGWQFQDWAGKADPNLLRDVIDRLGDPKLWPAAPKGLDAFERLALREYATAAEMDVLSARRALVTRAIRAGDAPPARALRRLAADLGRMRRDFETLWLARNRPSRLRENLRLFRRAEREASRAAT